MGKALCELLLLGQSGGQKLDWCPCSGDQFQGSPNKLTQIVGIGLNEGGGGRVINVTLRDAKKRIEEGNFLLEFLV